MLEIYIFLCKLNLQIIRKFKDSKKKELWQVFGDVPQSKKGIPDKIAGNSFVVLRRSV